MNRPIEAVCIESHPLNSGDMTLSHNVWITGTVLW